MRKQCKSALNRTLNPPREIHTTNALSNTEASMRRKMAIRADIIKIGVSMQAHAGHKFCGQLAKMVYLPRARSTHIFLHKTCNPRYQVSHFESSPQRQCHRNAGNAVVNQAPALHSPKGNCTQFTLCTTTCLISHSQNPLAQHANIHTREIVL